MIRTDLNTFAIGIGCAIGLHLLAVTALNGIKMHEPIQAIQLVVNMENTDTPISSEPSALGIEGLTSNDVEENKVANKKREIFLQYLDDIGACVHSNRFLMPGSSDVIGIASFLVRIDAEGNFSQVRLRSSSGKEKLDAAAQQAVEACSGKVKRPPSTGIDPLVMLQEVRYQYKER